MGEFKVLVVSASPQWGEALIAAFRENHTFEVIGACSDHEGVVEEVVRCYPDVVIWKLGPKDPVGLVHELHDRCPFTIPIILVDNPQQVNLSELLAAGVRGCLPLRLLPRQIVQAVELIVKAGILCLPRLPSGNAGPDFNSHLPPPFSSLSRREYEILTLLTRNLSNKEIASKLFISESTVKAHLESIYRKLGVKNRAEAAMLAVRAGFPAPAPLQEAH